MRYSTVFLLLASCLLPALASQHDVVPDWRDGDNFLDELDYIDLTALLGTSEYCMGVGYDGTNLWVTDAAEIGGHDNWIHIISLDGVLVQSVEQNATSGWGLRDLCFDSNFMYGSESNRVDYYRTDNYQKEGAYYCYAVSPNRAQAFDGTYFYTGSFSTNIYQVQWDGVSGSTASFSIWSTAIANGGTYGAAFDAYNDCLWISTASGELYQLATNGSLISVYTVGFPMGGCSGGNVSGHPLPTWPLYKALWIMDQGTPEALRAFELMPDTPLERMTWGALKILF